MLAAVAAHYDVLALAVEVVGDVEHHALDEFKGASAAVDLTGDIEPLVVAAVIEPRVELYLSAVPAVTCAITSQNGW